MLPSLATDRASARLSMCCTWMRRWRVDAVKAPLQGGTSPGAQAC
jgi:hypothetical protein